MNPVVDRADTRAPPIVVESEIIIVGTFVNDIALFPALGNVMVNVLLEQEVVPAHRFAAT